MKWKTPFLVVGAAAVAGAAYAAYDFFKKHEVTVTVEVDEKDQDWDEDSCCCGDEDCECTEETCECEEHDTYEHDFSIDNDADDTE